MTVDEERMQLSATFAKIAEEVAKCPYCLVTGLMHAVADHGGRHSIEIEIKALSCRAHGRAFIDAMKTYR